MNSRMKQIRKLLHKSYIFNIIIGIVFIISLIILWIKPDNYLAILTACGTGGLMNVMYGFKMMKDPRKKSTGMTYILLGMILCFIGFLIIQYVKK